MRNAILIPHNREGLAPVTLTAKEPVAQAIGCCGAPQSLGFQPLRHRCLCSILIEAIEANLIVRRVNRNAITGVGTLAEVVSGRILRVADGADDIQIETLGEFPVAIIVRGNCHDRTGAVIHKDIVSNEHGNLTTIHRVNCPQAGEDTRLLPCVFCALLRSLCCSLCTVGGDGLSRRCIASTPRLASPLGPAPGNFQCCLVRGRSRGRAAEERVLGRPDNEGCAEESIGARRIDGKATIAHAFANRSEVNLCTMRAADPIALHGAHLFGPINGVQVFDQAITVSSDTHHPLAQ